MIGGRFDGDERGVEPVVGVLLLVAIAIVMAAVLGQYVFGYDLVQSPEAGPQISFSTDYDEDAKRLNLTHESGDELEQNQTTVVVSGGDDNHNATWTDDPLTSGEEIRITGIQREETVRLVWMSPETGDSYVVLLWKGPDAGE